LKDFKVRFVPSFVVITLWSSLLQIHMHCFSNTPDFAARLFTHFPNFTSDGRYGTHSFFPFPSHPVSTDVITYSTTYLLTLNVLYLPLLLLYVTGFLEREEAVEMPYGDDTGLVRDEHGEEGWNAEGYDTRRRVRTV
jgi:hypothetical protein